MKGTVYAVILNGDLKYATNIEEVAQGYAENENSKAVNEAIEEAGRDIDDLTPEEISEFEIMAGFDGLYEVEAIEVPEGFDPDESVELPSGETFTFGDIAEVYEEMDEDFMFNCDNIEDMEVEDDLEDVFSDDLADDFDDNFDEEYEDFDEFDEETFQGSFDK